MIKASDIIREKLIASGGTATVRMVRGGLFTITITSDGKAFETKKLPGVNYGFDVFDIVLDLLHKNGGKAKKGKGRSSAKLGQPGCELDTVDGAVGHLYMGKQVGESILSPAFALAAILEWAELCHNKDDGEIELRRER